MDTVVSLHAALPAPEAGQPPPWVHLTPAGTFSGMDGRGPYRLGNAAAVIAASMSGGPLVIDENHSTDLAGPAGAPAPARGWIAAMEARDDGLWGRVEWTGPGGQMVAERAYRGLSPALSVDKKTGAVLRVLRAGLTNTPNLTVTTLHHRETTSMDLDALRQALGLAAGASEAECLAAARAATQAVSRHSAELARLAAAAGAPAGADVGVIETVLHTVRGSATEANRMAQQIVELNTQLGAIQSDRARERAVAAIDGALRAGKPITALREHYITRHMADPAAVDLELGAMVSLHSGGLGHRPAVPGATHAAEEAEVASRMGLKPEQLAPARAAREARRNQDAARMGGV
jgi:phage I-like protein